MEENRRVAVLHWYDDVDDLAQTVTRALTELGYRPFVAHYTSEALEGAHFLFTYAPWGRLQRVAAQLAKTPPQKRPFWVHWSTEDCPDIRLPGWVTVPVGRTLAWLDRWQEAEGLQGRLAHTAPLRWVNRRFHKFRYVGIYHHALNAGLMGLLVEYSKVYADYYNRAGIPARYAQWGLLDNSHRGDLRLERDIDVLWIGTRRTKRRSRLLDKVMGELAAYGKRVLIVDGSGGPVYGEARTLLLNRAKIMLNLLPTWYDSALAYRWPLAAANRALLVTEDSLPHAPEFSPGEHYVAAPASQLTPTILDYLEHPEKREPIVERAYQVVMHGHSIVDSVRQIMHWAEQGRQAVRQAMHPAHNVHQPVHTFTIPYLDVDKNRY